MARGKKGVVLHGKHLVGTTYGVDELWADPRGATLIGNGGPGEDIYHGGKSRDEFIHGVSGNNKIATTKEIIYNYTSGQDDIFYRGTYKKGTVSGRDVILHFTNGTVRVKNGVGKAITLISEKDGSEKVYTFGTPVLSKGLFYQNNRHKLLVKAPFKGTIKKWSYDSSVKEIDASGIKNTINIEGNKGNLIIRAGQGGGTIWASSGNDKIYGGKGIDVFRYQRKDEGDYDGKDTIYNYESGRDIIRVERGWYQMRTDGNDVVMSFGNKYTEINHKRIPVGADTVRIVDGVGKKILIEDGNGKRVVKTLYRKMPTYASYNSKTATVTFNSKAPASTFDVQYYGASIRGLNGKAASKRLNLTGNNQNNTIYAGKAGGVLSGMGGNDTLYGGNGVDTFRYTSGADTIVNYQAGRDVIQLAAGSITAHKVWGSDVTLNIGKGKILVKDGVNKKILVKDAKGKTKAYQYGYLNLPSTAAYDKTKTKVTMKANAKGNFESTGYAPKIVTIDAKAAKAAMNIYSNTKNNTIYASNKGGILQGRGGSDTLYGGAGKDTFVYANGDGNDVINSYTPNQDVIKLLSGKVDSYRLSGKDVILHIGKGRIRVKDAMNKKITFADAKGKTYNRTYSNVIRAGKTGGYLRGNGGDDIFYGNSGTDTFVYSAGDGNMTINNYASGRDIIYLEAGTVKNWTSKGNDAIINVGAKTITIKDGVNRRVIVEKKNGEKYIIPKGTKHAQILADGVTFDTDKKIIYMQDDDIIQTWVNGKDLIIDTFSQILEVPGIGNSPFNIQDSDGSITGYWNNKSFNFGYFDVEKKAVVMHTWRVDWNNDVNLSSPAIPDGYHTIDIRNVGGDFSLEGTDNNDTFYGGMGTTEFYGYGGTDKFYGGTGKDLFRFDGEKNCHYTVFNYDKTRDQISLGAYYDGYIVKGKDVVFKYYDSTMTVKNVAAKDINVDGDAAGKWRKDLLPGYLKYEKREDTRAAVLDSSFSGNSIDKLKVLSDTNIVDASKVKSYIKMDDVHDRFSTLIAGQGGSQLRVYKGGKTLVGGAGKDSFEMALKEYYYEPININNYEKRKDKIKITGNLLSASESGNCVSLTVGEGVNKSL